MTKIANPVKKQDGPVLASRFSHGVYIHLRTIWFNAIKVDTSLRGLLACPCPSHEKSASFLSQPQQTMNTTLTSLTIALAQTKSPFAVSGPPGNLAARRVKAKEGGRAFPDFHKFGWALRILLLTLSLSGIATSTGKTAPLPLSISQATAFAFLGHSCGGIQEHAYATGFDATTGYPMGAVYLQTRCGGSGRGGGYHTTTYTTWVAVTWDFAGNAVTVAKIGSAPAIDPTFSATDAYGDQIYNLNNAAYLRVYVPYAPTIANAAQTGDQIQLSWQPNGVNPAAITSTILTATPVGSTAAVVSVTVLGTIQTGLVGPLEPNTTYQVIAVNATIAGTGPASSPVTLTTVSASIAPSAPTGVTARWGGQGNTTATLLASWKASLPGNSPVDQYLITITGSDGGGTFTQSVPGTTLTANFTVDFTPDWTVTVKAHNAAGWSPSSTRITLGGL